jgi:tRNA threonylcarbamoyladenosine biosynthesis protein TsaE
LSRGPGNRQTRAPMADRPIRITLADEAATASLAARCAALARPGDALLLEGPLGAGKSAFARAFLRAATRDRALEVPSPTFTLVQSYELPSGAIAHHFDLYRLSGPEELGELGWEEAREGIVLVEWPERLGWLRPSDALTITLAPADTPEARIATINGWPDRSVA